MESNESDLDLQESIKEFNHHIYHNITGFLMHPNIQGKELFIQKDHRASNEANKMFTVHKELLLRRREIDVCVPGCIEEYLLKKDTKKTLFERSLFTI